MNKKASRDGNKKARNPKRLLPRNVAELLDVVRHNADGMVIVDARSMVRFVNPSAEAIFGRTAENVISQPFSLSFSPFQTTEHTVTRESGERLVVEIRAAMTHWDGEDAFLLSIRDITQRKAAEEQLASAMSDLKFALASEKVLLDELDKRNKELIELSITDGLTGLYNHRFIQERFEFEFKRIKRYGGHLSCMMIDIDHFKAVNDTYGHQFGDYVLREIGGIIRQKSREVDICARYGGEEFMIITNVVIDFAMKFATKLHTAVDSHQFMFNDKAIHITVSIGLADYSDDLKTRNELIERADEALYQAKGDGRNLIRIWKENGVTANLGMDHFSVQELKTKLLSLSQQVRASYMEYTNALVMAIDAKDSYTKEHSQNVAAYAVAIAKALGLSEKDVEIIKYASLLHDIGKISISHEILSKTTPLSKEEYHLLQRHPVVGVTILKDIKFLEKEIPIILHHHERFDGKGYPQGLMGREIPLGARIVAIADAYDAMTCGREYKSKLDMASAIAELKAGSGTQFAPDIVECFVELLEKKE
jgi:diguanylate cyclase (GGDEF)-like protein/putative nucleotidyltransferase with HDIG domain/PAS domain S-box-containing protein